MYTDVNAVIPAQTILAVAAVLVALIFIVTAITARWRLSLVGAAMLVITAIVGTGVYPFLVQEYQVGPTEQTLESEYIERNMDLTRFAYGLDDLEQEDYQATPQAQQGALAGDEANIENLRLLDPNLVSPAYRQFQQFRPYYQFPDTLSFDRYEIDGEMHDTVIAAREVNAPTEGSWVNQHLIYTHGYGLVAASANTVTDEGRPEFTLQGIPTTGELASDDDYQPRIYFGENSPQYSIAGAPEGTSPMELDRPAAQIVEDEDGEAVEEGDDGQDTQYTFTGDGGPSVGNLFSRLVYAMEFGSPEIFLSGDMNEESQILYNRHPRERVMEVAPYLEVDQNIYPAIVDGGVKWIIEGYTTSNSFPYSTQQQLESATEDALTDGPALTGQVNYMRNSVKATVDAYDGSVELYAWDDEDPILQAWQDVFPSSLQSYEDMSAELLDHIRYPEDMFRIQRQLLTEYHVDNPGTFYEGNDAWSIPSDPTGGDDAMAQPPYYMTMQMPGQEDPSFQLTSTFIPATEADGQQRNVLYGFLAASGDAGTGEDGVKNEGYGDMRLLELPRDTAIPGPGQTQANFDSNSTIASQLNILELGGSEVLRGNMISMPAGDGILNAQPIYVQATGTGAAYPALRMVLVAFGEEVGYGDTLQEALDMIFDGDAGVEAAEGAGVDAEAVEEDLDGVDPEAVEDEEAVMPEEDEDDDADEPAEEAAPAEPIDGDMEELLQRAGELMNESQEAMSESDWTAYGEAQDELDQVIEQMLEQQEG
ncbi:UPF0182 family protein [Nesterenkonia pannonica]|uniref:UPF0182 family membrane protein n=1 Tax=Nesterenkonia pannonica TaxID=1548602 RepID=UPI00216495DC|nr:UPF0182 family protein [Nesterenkonia pannonica]